MTRSVAPINDDRRICLRRGSAPASTFAASPASTSTISATSPAGRPAAHR